MKKKTKQLKIGENQSSGAEKVEELIKMEKPENVVAAQTVTSTGMSAPAAQNTAAYTDSTGKDEEKSTRRLRLTAAQLEAQAARRRVQKAVAKKKEEERLQAIKEEKQSKKSKWRLEYEQAEERERQRLNNDKKKDEKPPKRAPGIGGWLAAVVVLGATTLALGTVVAVGGTTMARERNGNAASTRGVLYEFVSVVEGLEKNLDEVRVVTSAPLQSQLLTGVLASAKMAEMDLEKLPLTAQADHNLTTYLNMTAYACEGMLAKLRTGEGLDEKDALFLEHLHDVSEKVADRLAEMMDEMQDKDMLCMMKGKDCCIGDAMKDIEGLTMPKLTDERRIPPRSKEKPSMQNKGESTLTSNQAKEYCLRYFADYGLTDASYDGETVARRMCTYNFTMQDKDGVRLFAQIDEKDGALVAFDYYRECTEKKIDEDTCLKKAVAFLSKLGYEDMTAVDTTMEGTNMDIRFALQKDDVVHYGKEVTVKVCMERGKVVGLNAEKYIENKWGMAEFNAKISLQEAKDGLDEKLTIESSRAVVFPYKGKTYSAYEFFCSRGGEYYFLYVDAATGNQLFVKRV